MKQYKLEAFTRALLSSLILLVTVSSCSSSDDNRKKDEGEKKLILQTESSTSVLENTPVLFKITEDGNILDDAQLFVNNEAILENPYTFTTEGSYVVIAKKEGYINSNSITIKVFKEEIPVIPVGDRQYQHRVLMEDFTGVQCGPCASAIRALERLETHTYSGNGHPVDYSNIVVVGVHVSIPGPDPFALPQFAHPLFDFYNNKVVNDPARLGSRWAPFIVINGKSEWDTRTMTTVTGQNHPMTLVQKSSAIGIKITSELGTTSGFAEAEIAFAEDYEGLTMDYYIVEDDVQHSQAGIGTNYLHHAVLKATTTAITGIAIPTAQSKKGNIFVPESFLPVYKTANTDKLRVIVVIRAANGDVLNVQDANANSTKDFVIID